MAQLILELNDETAERLRRAAAREWLSESQWLERLLKRAVGRRLSENLPGLDPTCRTPTRCAVS